MIDVRPQVDCVLQMFQQTKILCRLRLKSQPVQGQMSKEKILHLPVIDRLKDLAAG